MPRSTPKLTVCAVELATGRVVALLRFDTAVQEVFAVALLSRRFPDLINDDEKLSVVGCQKGGRLFSGNWQLTTDN